MPKLRLDAPPILLANADFYGTLAAARSLGRQGVPVIVAHHSRLSAASWSRFVHRFVSCPSTSDSKAFHEWLVDFGKRSPGCVLYPTSDDTAFIYASHRQELLKYFHLYGPPAEPIYALLNKRKLYAQAPAHGLEVPRTWFPQTLADLEEIRREASGPLLIKPVTQVLFATHRKGEWLTDHRRLAARYRAFAEDAYAPELIARDPAVGKPMVQEFHPGAQSAIYTLTGFLTQQGKSALRGARKVLQLPRRLGVGICFEDAPIDPALAAGITALLRHLSYWGVFEAEFICTGTQRLLIDLNPRFYGQMNFDLERGLPLGQLAYEAALGHRERVTQLLRAASAPAAGDDEAGVAFCHKAALDLVLRSQTLSRAMPADEARGWRTWLENHATIDAVADGEDWAPAAIDSVSRWSAYARHPRSFLRAVVLNR